LSDFNVHLSVCLSVIMNENRKEFFWRDGLHIDSYCSESTIGTMFALAIHI